MYNCDLKQIWPLSFYSVCFMNEYGIHIDGERACLLFYADDIVMLVNTEGQLQELLDGLYIQCNYNKNDNECL